MALHNYTTNYQIPLRLSDALAAELHDVAEATGIQKSKLVRMGLSRLIRDFQSSGLSERMNQISREYEEIV
jgi:hypothetical protein